MRGPRRVGRWLGLALLVVIGAVAVRALTFRPLAVVGDAPSDGFTRVRGAVHVHTSLSDGGGTPEDVVAAAKAAGLQFVAITDHNNADAKTVEGWHDGVLALVGSEISSTHGHVLALGIDAPAFRFSGDALDALDDTRHLQGFAFAAHPTSGRDDLRWTGWDLPGAWGVELWNGDSAWRSAGALRLARAAIAYPFGPRYALLSTLRTPAAALERWDGLLARRDAAGIAGADAHQRLAFQRQEGTRKGRALPIPRYGPMLGLAVNHVLLDAPLTGDARSDTRTVAAALARGRSYMSVDALADGSGFSFVAEGPAGRRTMGDTVAPASGLVLRAGGRLPEGAVVHILRNGQRASGPVAENPPPGVYRAEVHVPGWGFPWILSNPIVVAAPDEEARRRAAAAPPPALDATPGGVIDDFGGPTTFGPEFDPSSSMEQPVVVPGAGPDGSPAARLRFRLGAPGEGRPYTWCALVSRTPRDLAGRTGLAFNVKSDKPWRIWVQVRDENPASADEGTEWWFASVRTGPDWSRQAVPFERFRSINKKTDGRLDLDKVRQLVFVLDPGAVPPGTSGEITIDDVAVY